MPCLGSWRASRCSLCCSGSFRPSRRNRSKAPIQVDAGNAKQTGATFGYRLTYYCSSTSGPCLNAEVVDLLPPEVQQVSTVPASPTGDVAAINVTPNSMGSGRTLVRFVLINPLPAGNSGDSIVNVRFPNGSTPDGTVATNTVDAINLGATPGVVTLWGSSLNTPTNMTLTAPPPGLGQRFPGMVQGQQRGDTLRRHRLAEVEALPALAPERQQLRALRFRFDALGNDTQVP